MQIRLPAILAVVTVALGGFAVWSHQKADGLRDTPSARNVALTENARTSEVKGEVTDALNTVFSYSYADVAKTDKAARTVLTGRAVQQYDATFAPVRKSAPEQKLVLTTTVTDSAVKMLQADRARLLIFADQRSTRGSDGKSSYAGAMLAVDAVRRGGHWRISDIDTFSGNGGGTAGP
jgi:Mce-associated membrane protein